MASSVDAAEDDTPRVPTSSAQALDFSPKP